MVDFVDKKQELRRYFPRPAYKLEDQKGLAILLDIIGNELNIASEDIEAAKQQFQLASAVSTYLAIHGQNLDVYKPRGSRMTDVSYRNLIKVIANGKKNAELVFERLLQIFFGVKVFDRQYADVYTYRPNEIVVRISRTAMIIASSRDLYGTTYMHRTNDVPYDGGAYTPWQSTISATIPIGSTTLVMSSVPAGCPETGIVEVGDPSDDQYEIKGYTRVGNVMTLQSPTYFQFLAGKPLTGPERPDNYPSGYLYDSFKSAAIFGSYSAGETEINISGETPDFPSEGVAYIGSFDGGLLEAKAFSLAGGVMTLEGALVNPHTSGEPIAIPVINRKINTTLTSPISAGASLSEIDVFNAADFPVGQGAIKINKSFNNEEIIPCRGRAIGNNQILYVDPGYVFKNDHGAGEQVQLMALKTDVTRTGEDWPFYLVDSDDLRDQFLSILQRVKVTGFKMKIDFVG